jgi:outer membrane biosynthesis protein TonB
MKHGKHTYRCYVQGSSSLEQNVHVLWLHLASADQDLVGQHQRKQQLVPLKQATLQGTRWTAAEQGTEQLLRGYRVG